MEYNNSNSQYKQGYKEAIIEVEMIRQLGINDKIEEISYYEERIGEELRVGDSYSQGYIKGLREELGLIKEKVSDKKINNNKQYQYNGIKVVMV